MAAELVTQLDPESFTPLPIAPCFELGKLSLQNSDEHHGWHPKFDPALQTVAGMALRNSWIQRTHKDLHNRGPFSYHRFFVGPKLPTEELDILGRVIISCAGYVPKEVIDMRGKSGPLVRQATEDEYRYLRKQNRSNEFGYERIRYGYDPIRVFFQQIALNQDISHLPEVTLDEFLHTSDSQRRLKIGQHILWLISDQATEPIAKHYSKLVARQLVHPLMPQTVKPLFKWKLGSRKRISEEFIPRLQQRMLM